MPFFIPFVIQFGIIISICEMFAQYNLKKKQIALGIVGYIGVSLILFTSYKYVSGLGQMNLCWSCISIITAFILGYVFFNEPITNNTCMAVCFALIAIYFANR